MNRLSPPFAQKISKNKQYLLLIFCFFACSLTFIQVSQQTRISFDTDAKKAAELSQKAMEELKLLRLELIADYTQSQNLALNYQLDSDLNPFIDPKIDPTLSGLIGVDYSDITTTLGDLRAKQLALNPNFAALIVMWLKQLQLEPQSKVALSLSSSFPNLNLDVIIACQLLELNPIIINSVGSSSYGANLPNFTWLDMETRLYERKLIEHRSNYASFGGIVDSQGGLYETGFITAQKSIAKHGAKYLDEGRPKNLVADLERRMAIYTQDSLPKAYINVGGNITALGWVNEASFLDNGLLTRIPKSTSPQRGLIFRMFELGVPVIHLINIENLTSSYNLQGYSLLSDINTLNKNIEKSQNIIVINLGLFLFSIFSFCTFRVLKDK